MSSIPSSSPAREASLSAGDSTNTLRKGRPIADAHNNFPRALSALEAAMEQIGFMETDAENHHNQGREDACKALLDYADTLRSVVQSELAKTAIPGTDPSNDPEGDA